MLFPPKVREMVKQAIAYENRIKAGELTREQAEKELREKYGRALDGAMTIVLTCRDGDVRAEVAEYRRALAAAKKAYEGSEAQRDVEAARKKLAAKKRWL
jgi:hypothetical protein